MAAILRRLSARRSSVGDVKPGTARRMSRPPSKFPLAPHRPRSKWSNARSLRPHLRGGRLRRHRPALDLEAIHARGQIDPEPRALPHVFAARDGDVVSHQHRVGHDIEGRPVRGRGLAVLHCDKNALFRLLTGKLLASPLSICAEARLARVYGREGDRAKLDALLQLDDASEHLGSVCRPIKDLNKPVGLNVDRRIGIYFEGAERALRQGRSRLAALRHPLSLVEGCGNAALRILVWAARGARSARRYASATIARLHIGRITPRRLRYHRTGPTLGTFRWLCIEHVKSTAFKQLDPRTQHETRLIVEKMFQEPIAPGVKELFGDCPLSRFDAKAVRILRDRRADRPEAANNRVRRLRRIFKWAVDSDIEGVTVNPARDVPLLRPVRAGGFPTWTVADIEKFERRHPIGSKARLALALLSYTGVRRPTWSSLGNST